jgi:hypothetical protein
MVRINVNYMLPTRTSRPQGSLDVPERLSNLVCKRFGNLQIVIPATLSRYFYAIANFYRLRVMQVIQHVFPITRGNKKLGLIHGVPLSFASAREDYFCTHRTKRDREPVSMSFQSIAEKHLDLRSQFKH